MRCHMMSDSRISSVIPSGPGTKRMSPRMHQFRLRAAHPCLYEKVKDDKTKPHTS